MKKKVSLAQANTLLSKEWHPDKNRELTPNDVTPGANLKVWWLCTKKHSFYSTISNRKKGSGCPFCAGKKASPENNLYIKNLKLSKEWHPTRNGTLKPNEVLANSHIKVWWICPKKHVYESVIYSRNNGVGCPYCAGKKICMDNCLGTLNPELSKQWHTTRNGKLAPYNIAPNTHIKVWWICSIGHEYESTVLHRNNGTGCPYCTGKKVCKDNSLATLNSELANQWHPIKNGELTPYDVTTGSGKKIWWVCDNEHEWRTSVAARNKGSGCPFCSGQKVSFYSSLENINPVLAKEWNTIKNGKLTPKDVASQSHKKVWWLCHSNHSFKAVIANRQNGTQCPFCSGRYVTKERNLATLSPQLSNEWHPTKNGELTAKEVMPYSNIKVWWICPLNHSYQSLISNRSNGAGCVYCSSRTSLPEKRLFAELKYLFPSTTWMYRELGFEIDIYIPKYKIGVEYDGAYYHLDKYENDLNKNTKANALGIKIIRIREHGLTKVSNIDIILNKKGLIKEKINLLINYILKMHPLDRTKIIDNYIDNSNFANDMLFNSLLNKSVPYEKSIASCDHAMNLWDYEINAAIEPEYLPMYSNHKIWWRCTKKHRFKAYIYSVASGVGCSYCAGKRACKDNCLATKLPDLANEWHPTKNKELTPYDVTTGSGKKVWSGLPHE